MDTALLLVVAAVIGGGVAGALLRTWSIHSRLFSLETRLGVAEGVLTRETKTRAAQERWKKSDKAEEEILALAASVKNAGTTRVLNWWEKGPTPNGIP